MPSLSMTSSAHWTRGLEAVGAVAGELPRRRRVAEGWWAAEDVMVWEPEVGAEVPVEEPAFERWVWGWEDMMSLPQTVLWTNGENTWVNSNAVVSSAC